VTIHFFGWPARSRAAVDRRGNPGIVISALDLFCRGLLFAEHANDGDVFFRRPVHGLRLPSDREMADRDRGFAAFERGQRSGALELLLVTPLKTEQILEGNAALWETFRGPMAMAVATNVALFWMVIAPNMLNMPAKRSPCFAKSPWAARQ